MFFRLGLTLVLIAAANGAEEFPQLPFITPRPNTSIVPIHQPPELDLPTPTVTVKDSPITGEPVVVSYKPVYGYRNAASTSTTTTPLLDQSPKFDFPPPTVSVNDSPRQDDLVIVSYKPVYGYPNAASTSTTATTTPLLDQSPKFDFPPPTVSVNDSPRQDDLVIVSYKPVYGYPNAASTSTTTTTTPLLDQSSKFDFPPPTVSVNDSPRQDHRVIVNFKPVYGYRNASSTSTTTTTTPLLDQSPKFDFPPPTVSVNDSPRQDDLVIVSYKPVYGYPNAASTSTTATTTPLLDQSPKFDFPPPTVSVNDSPRQDDLVIVSFKPVYGYRNAASTSTTTTTPLLDQSPKLDFPPPTVPVKDSPYQDDRVIVSYKPVYGYRNAASTSTTTTTTTPLLDQPPKFEFPPPTVSVNDSPRQDDRVIVNYKPVYGYRNASSTSTTTTTTPPLDQFPKFDFPPPTVSVKDKPVYGYPNYTSTTEMLQRPQQLSAEWDFKCPKRYAFYRYQQSCDIYIECRNFQPKRKVCPDGMHFKEEPRWSEYPCAYPPEAKCLIRENGLPARPTADCPHQFGNFPITHEKYSKNSRCNSYISCSSGVAHVMNCSFGLVFNPEINLCDWPEQVPSCQDVFDFHCPVPHLGEEDMVINYRYPKDSSCRSFYSCSNGNYRLLACDEGLLFDHRVGRCVEYDDYTCGKYLPENDL